MRILTLSLAALLICGTAVAAEGDFQKARIRRVHVGYVIPPPPDAGEADKNDGNDKEAREAEEQRKYEHSAFVFLQVETKQIVMQVYCGEHCNELKQKLDASRDVEVRIAKPKMWLKTSDQTLTGKIYRPEPTDKK
jgi:hypothetical protein